MGGKIPFNVPTTATRSSALVAAAVRAGALAGDGPFTRQASAVLEQTLGAPRVLLTTSCTDALEMAALLLDLEPGDEVLVPSFTFVSTANAFAMRGARPVFVDVRADTLNLDEARLEGAIGPRTRAIVVVHYAGVGCEMDAILETAGRHGLPVVEDNAHGLFARYRGRLLGTLGRFATQSFHETKNFTCGEGGALVVNRGSDVERAEIVREKGTDRSKFFRGQVDKYGWVDLGSSHLPSDVLAALLVAQLEERERVQERRRAVWLRYRDGLTDWASAADVRLPVVPAHCDPAWHLFHLILPTLPDRQRFIVHLREAGMQAVFHYLPLHLSPMGRRFGGRAGLCPVTEWASDRLVRLPFYTDLAAEDQDRVIERVRQWQPARVGVGA